MDAEEGVKCLSTHLKQSAVPLRALSFTTAGEKDEKDRKRGRGQENGERGKTGQACCHFQELSQL